MKRAAYSVDRLQDLCRVTVTPDMQIHGLFLLALTPLEILLLVALTMWFGALGGVAWVIQGALTWVVLTRAGEWNRGRADSVLHVSPWGVHKNGGRILLWTDIQILQMTAPNTGGVAIVESRPGLVSLLGKPPPAGVMSLITERSWRVEAISQRHVRVLAGGLTESIARGVLQELSGRLRSSRE